MYKIWGYIIYTTIVVHVFKGNQVYILVVVVVVASSRQIIRKSKRRMLVVIVSLQVDHDYHSRRILDSENHGE